jgi:hypothetical protein
MKIFFAKRTFSKKILKWWINLQQQHIASGVIFQVASEVLSGSTTPGTSGYRL